MNDNAGEELHATCQVSGWAHIPGRHSSHSGARNSVLTPPVLAPSLLKRRPCVGHAHGRLKRCAR